MTTKHVYQNISFETFKSLKSMSSYARRPGVKIFVMCKFTDSDSFQIEVKKSSFLKQISIWNEVDYDEDKSGVQIYHGHIHVM